MAYRWALIKLLREPVHTLIPRPRGEGPGDCGGTVATTMSILIYIVILYTISPIEKSAIVHPIRCEHVSNLTNHIIAYNYSMRSTLVTII